jgi:hypothetical protein
MLLKNKYAIGTHIMFYEIDMIDDFVNSCIIALGNVDNKTNVVFDFCLNMSQYFESYDTPNRKEYVIDKWNEVIKPLEELTTVNTTFYTDDVVPYTLSFYRRDFNTNYCQDTDYLIWGESDCLIPKETFDCLETLKEYTNSENVHRFITTFAMRKMWDPTWDALVHQDFISKPYYEMDTPEEIKLATTSPWSIRYTMDQEEMEEINGKVSEYDIKMLTYPKFDGSCLVISSDLVMAGVNIPPAVYINGDDTSFMNMCDKIIGKQYKQYVFKNIMKVHNRNHPRKRRYIKGEDESKITHYKRKDQTWYQKFNDISKGNLGVLFNSQNRFKRIREIND